MNRLHAAPGSRLLRNVKVRTALQTRIQARDAKTIADADERDRFLSAIARDTKAGDSERIPAIVELNCCSGRHSVTLHHRGRSLEDILGESLQARPGARSHSASVGERRRAGDRRRRHS